ncbi:sensor histidine kinase [Leifsonia shinshuensis]|uniref:sensor histidine kinase n=1 Tax=Leifsonia shinshuensis TaxID=150026 RepID=UPI001F5049D6|nr:sensor histidine kinase [Leifsonia shinshuensis]MCI0157998.1 sensor histidine kinase [Leifsonia shinshuensis]
MSHSALTPVFVGLRVGLHVLIAGLLVLVVVRLPGLEPQAAVAGLVLAVLFAVVYLTSLLMRAVPPQSRRRAGVVWISALGLVWVGLVIVVPEAAYLAFPLFFLCLHLLPRWVGPVAVVALTVVAIVALSLHQGFSAGVVIGPLIGAAVAILLGLGYRALAREAVEREALLTELMATRDRLAATEREQGALAERGRLARDIHDTVAQGLSSIQLLLHAAERADPDGPGIEQIRLARTTAADSLAETRHIIRELTPPSLDGGLGEALQRLGAAQAVPGSLRVDVETPPAIDLPMDVQTAFLRIAQGAMANVRTHSGATHARILLRSSDDGTVLRIADDGVGFDPDSVGSGAGGADSFGLRAIAERVAQLGGHLSVESAPGEGTSVTVTLRKDAT